MKRTSTRKSTGNAAGRSGSKPAVRASARKGTAPATPAKPAVAKRAVAKPTVAKRAAKFVEPAAGPAAKSAKPAATPAKPGSTTLRSRAEAAVRASPVPATPPGDAKRMLHELQVHQVELEMQNEELRRANDELASLHARYHDLYDFAPVAYFTLGADRRLVELNLAGARMLGMERSRLVGRRFADYVQLAARPRFDQLVARALVRDELVEDALTLEGAGSAPVHVKAQVRRVEGGHARIVLVDVSALRAANDELANALEKFLRYWRP
jgi:PAS domain S-box-containing protein